VTSNGEKGLTATATGNLPRNVFREAASAYWGDESIREDGRIVPIGKEEDFSHLHVTQLVEGLSGLIRKSR